MKFMYFCSKQENMHIIKLKVNNEAYKHLMWFLAKFKKEELQIIKEDDEFVSVQKYLQEELTSIENGSAEFVDIDELDAELEATLRQYED